MMKLTRTEWRVVLIVAAVQFANTLDFSMVSPMGPQLAVALNISTAHVGYLGGTYIAAAFIAGLIGTMVLDKVDRRLALGVVMTGLVIATALCGFAVDMKTMLAARTMAGLCGGPAAAISLAIVADSVAVERRGRAMGVVAGAYGLALILGIPAGLQLALLGGWQLPFFSVAGFGAMIVVSAYTMLPPQRRHLEQSSGTTVAGALKELYAVAARPTTLMGLGIIALLMSGVATVMSNLASYLVFNLAFPPDLLGMLWMAGGIVGVGASQLTGRLTDRIGTIPIFWTAAIVSAITIGLICFFFPKGGPVWLLTLLFSLYLGGNMGCFVSWNAMLTKLPRPSERGRFMSLSASAQHAAGAIAIFLGASMLTELPGGSIAHMGRVVTLGIIAMLLAPYLAGLVDRRIKKAPPEQAAEPQIMFDEAGSQAAYRAKSA
jgi:predicted MFS family arabinose efflux permease